jgi:hypothetical protein
VGAQAARSPADRSWYVVHGDSADDQELAEWATESFTLLPLQFEGSHPMAVQSWSRTS